MVSLASLLLSVVLSAVLVFVPSSVLHMVMRYYSRDYTRLPNGNAVRAAIRDGNPAPAQSVMPYIMGPGEMRSAEALQKFVKDVIDSLNSGLMTAGTFAWLWPR